MDLTAIITRYPEKELAIRRLAGIDHDFAELCDIFAVATCALERWKSDPAMKEEYHQIVRELNDEICRHLDRHTRTTSKEK